MIMKKILCCIVSVIYVFSFSSCASAPIMNTKNINNKEEKVLVKDEKIDDYILGIDDIIYVSVGQHPEWSGNFTIKPDGTIFIMGLGSIKVEGLIKEGAEVMITSVVEKYINNAKVIVDIIKYASQTIYVLGEVNRPGKIITEGKRLKLRDAIIMAGLPTRFGVTTRVYVISPTSFGKPKQQVINLYRILYRGETTRDIQLNPGDIVYVPQSLLGKISDFFSALLSPITTTRTAISTVP